MSAAPCQTGSYQAEAFARLLIVFLLSCVSLAAIDPHQPVTQMHHTAWSGKEGVIGAVLAIAQTTDGFIWLGTTGGLLRFDGSVMERYKLRAGSFPEPWVSALLATSDGGLWIGYLSGGASFLERDRVTNYARSEGLPDGRIRSFAQDIDGRVWVAATGGLGYFDGRWQVMSKNASQWGVPPNSPASVAATKRGGVWVSDAKQGVFSLPRGASEFQQLMPGPVPGYLPTFTEAGDEMWLWTPELQSLLRLPARERPANRPSQGVANSAGMFLVDHDGSGWMMTLHDGIWRIPVAEKLHGRISPNDPSIEKFSEREGLTNAKIQCVMEDREGNVWVGTVGGLDRFRPRNTTWTELQSAATRRMQLVAGDKGDVWVSSPQALWDARNGKPVRGSPAGIQFSFRDPNGAIWFWSEHGGSGAFWRWVGGQFLELKSPVSDPVRTRAGDPSADSWVSIKGPVRALARDGSGALWVSIVGRGVFRQDGGLWRQIEILKGEPYITAYGGTCDGEGGVWLAYPERSEIGHWNRGAIQVFSPENGLSIGPITQIAYSDGQVWAGGESGLAIYRKGRFHTVELADGAEFGMVTGIVGAPEFGLWLTTTAEIVHIPQNEVSMVVQDCRHRVQYETFDPVSDSGERLSDTSDTPAVMGTDGILWFATTRGVIRIDPAHLHRNLVAPLVAIRNLVARGQSYSLYAPVTLPARTTSLRVSYSVLAFSYPERARSRYRLLEYEKDWHDGGSRVEASYNKLGPGKYTFQVAARNNDGVWNKAGASLNFTIAPAFYQIVWFQLLYVLGAATVIYLLYRLRIRQMTARVQLRYAERLAERTRIARELHDTLLQSLAGVSLQLDGIAKQAGSGPEKFVALVTHVREEVDTCFLEARAKVWTLRSTSLEGQGLSATLREFCTRVSSSTTARCEFQLVGEPHPLAPEFEEELLRIAQEAVHNAVRHAHAQGIRVTLRYAKKLLTLTVSDDGRGFDVEEGLRKSDHWGLKNMQERATQIHAAYTLASTAGSGTKVEVRVPIAGKAFGRRRGDDPSSRGQ